MINRYEGKSFIGCFFFFLILGCSDNTEQVNRSKAIKKLVLNGCKISKNNVLLILGDTKTNDFNKMYYPISNSFFGEDIIIELDSGEFVSKVILPKGYSIDSVDIITK